MSPSQIEIRLPVTKIHSTGISNIWETDEDRKHMRRQRFIQGREGEKKEGGGHRNWDSIFVRQHRLNRFGRRQLLSLFVSGNGARNPREAPLVLMSVS